MAKYQVVIERHTFDTIEVEADNAEQAEEWAFMEEGKVVSSEGSPSTVQSIELLDGDDDVCPECEQERPDDDRVKAGMKCGPCAYGGGE